jgi:hypothetical protein
VESSNFYSGIIVEKSGGDIIDKGALDYKRIVRNSDCKIVPIIDDVESEVLNERYF